MTQHHILPVNPGGVVATQTDNVFDLDVVGTLFEEFLARHSRHAEDARFLADFKEQIRQLSGGARAYRYRGRVVVQDERNGRFALSQLEAYDPELVRRYTRWVTEERFDEEAFRQAEPVLWEQMRAQSFRLK